MVPHDLDEFWDDGPYPNGERLRLAFALYRAMPCYHFLAEIFTHDERVAGRDRRWMWDEVRSLLEDPDQRMSTWVEYWLWVDWFETRTHEAWEEVTRFEGDWQRRLKRVFAVSGPAPWSWKVGLYKRFVEEGPEWHESIYEGLLGSAFDVYGDIDLAEARELLARLPVPGNARGLKELREKLRR